MSDISIGIAALTVAVDIAKGLKNAKIGITSSKYKSEISELIDKLLKSKKEMYSMYEEISTKNDEIKKLKEKLEIKSKMVYVGPYYQLENAEGKLEGYYCKVCYISDNLLMPLDKEGESWICGKCNTRCYPSN